eukprot:TRINITY_DN9824_c0_g1_i1.p1 TRINITY_DN9824_c0_g1~~TRINITY_DN9824_c0_g1_i1.p1  ORF type:complete len:536 (+),score=142.80 TRINITY_DN9824_c0_g1_i1:157-1764(+)
MGACMNKQSATAGVVQKSTGPALKTAKSPVLLGKTNSLRDQKDEKAGDVEQKASNTYTAGKSLHKEVRGDGISRARFILQKTGRIQDVYEIEQKKLGEGAYGTVRVGVHKKCGSVRAIKTIMKARVNNLRRLEQEIGIMKLMDHPHIIKLYETFVDNRNVDLVMELCTGGELFDRIINAGHFTEATAAVVMQQIMRAVYHMHESGIVHRDLKPENFLFQNKGPIDTNVIKIIDFGLSCQRKPAGEYLKTKVGTPYYVSPQVLNGRYDHMCDLWSCGVIMYVLLAGYPPFNGTNDTEIFRKVRLGQVRFDRPEWRYISKDAQDLVRHLLMKQPQDRFSADQALQHDWIKDVAPRASNAPLPTTILDNLKTFRCQNKLKKAALHVIAGQMNEDEIKQLREIFVSLDTNGDGWLTLEELNDGFNKGGVASAGAAIDLQAIMEGIDADGSGMIDYSEFLAAALDRQQVLQEDLCWAAFRAFDVDGNGVISKAEIKEVLAVDGVSEAMGAEAIDNLLKDVDTNGDGEIDFTEFMAMMKAM